MTFEKKDQIIFCGKVKIPWWNNSEPKQCLFITACVEIFLFQLYILENSGPVLRVEVFMFVLMFQASFITNRCSEKEAIAPLSPFPPHQKKRIWMKVGKFVLLVLANLIVFSYNFGLEQSFLINLQPIQWSVEGLCKLKINRSLFELEYLVWKKKYIAYNG